MKRSESSRRDFLRLSAASLIGVSVGPWVLTHPQKTEMLRPEPLRSVPPSDTIGLGMIGMGIMGFGNARTALQIPGVRLVAVADCYDGRLVRTKEVFGPDVFTTRDYREVLAEDVNYLGYGSQKPSVKALPLEKQC